MADCILAAGPAPAYRPEAGTSARGAAPLHSSPEGLYAANLRDLGDEATTLRHIAGRLPQQDAAVSVKHINGSADRLDSIMRSLAASGATPTVAAAARANPLQERPFPGAIDRHDAELGMAWWNSLTEPQRTGWLAAAKTVVPAEAWTYYKALVCQEDTPQTAACPNAGTSAAAHGEALLDIAREIRAWGSIGLFGAADRLEALAQEMVS